MNGGVKVYTIACTDCIDNITNIAIIQLEKNESGELYFSFRFKRFCLFSDLPGQWPGRSEKRKNQSYNALPNLIAKLIVAKARTKAIKNWTSIIISSFPLQSFLINELHGLVHLFLSSLKFQYLDIEIHEWTLYLFYVLL